MKQRSYLNRSFIMSCVLVTLFTLSAGAADIPGYISASSVLYEPGYDHNAWCAQDHNLSTAWMEGVQGHGNGEYLEFETDRYAVITGGTILPGFYASEDLFYKNNAPTMLYIRTGSQEAYLDVTEYAHTFYPHYTGYHFVFDEPLVSDGCIRITILSVREGWKYDDTCITELFFEGYQATEHTVPVFDDDTPHVSVAFPDENYDGVDDNDAEPFLSPDGIGGDGLGPDEMYTDDPEYLDEETRERLLSLANILYKMHCHHANPLSIRIESDGLYSYSHAYALNWYQSQIEDDRILYANGYHYADPDDLEEIVEELFDTDTPAEDVQALCDYFGGVREGEKIRMNASGNSWDAGTFYLGTPYAAGEMMGRTLLMGNVMTFDPATQSYVGTMPYYAYFEQDEYDETVFHFDELIVE